MSPPRGATTRHDGSPHSRATIVGPRITGPRPTTLIESLALSKRLGARVHLASETFQWTGSFKFRAAYHVATHIGHPRVITASSGNFGQAMALSCQLVGKGCTVVMPSNSARVKVDAVRSFGATVDLIDVGTMSRQRRVAELAAADPDAYVASPYDDPLVIAGNASLGRELAAHSYDAVIAPIGGGGLASGVVTGLRVAGARTVVWGAEPAMANDLVQSLRAGRIVSNAAEPQTVADGARTVSVGQNNWEILRDGLAGAVEVPEEAILESVRLLFALANLKVEPTGAVSVAALLTDPDRFHDQHVCCVISGGNVDPDLYARIVGDRSHADSPRVGGRVPSHHGSSQWPDTETV